MSCAWLANDSSREALVSRTRLHVPPCVRFLLCAPLSGSILMAGCLHEPFPVGKGAGKRGVCSRRERRMNKLKRRIFLINRKLQLRFTLLVVLLVLIYSVFLGFATYLNYRISTIVFENTAIYDSATEVQIARQGKSTVVTTTVFLVINGVVVALIFILLTHKVAGPLYRLEQYTKMISDGKIPPRLIFRKGDELLDLAERFNEMTDTLRQTAQRDASELHTMAEELEKIAGQLRESKEPSEDLLKGLEQCVGKVASLRDSKRAATGA